MIGGGVQVWRARAVAATLLFVGALIFTLATGWVRNLLGDVLVVVFLVACLASIPVGKPWMRLLGVAVLSVGVEAFQGLGLVGVDSHWLAHLILGSTFDPVDLLAYAAGLLPAAAAERWWRPRSGVRPLDVTSTIPVEADFPDRR